MQAWLEEIKWQQTIDEEKEIAREEVYAEGERCGAQQNAIANAKLLIADGRYSLEEVAKLLNISEETLRIVVANKEIENASMA